jgi:hypothetical protein
MAGCVTSVIASTWTSSCTATQNNQACATPCQNSSMACPTSYLQRNLVAQSSSHDSSQHSICNTVSENKDNITQTDAYPAVATRRLHWRQRVRRWRTNEYAVAAAAAVNRLVAPVHLHSTATATHLYRRHIAVTATARAPAHLPRVALPASPRHRCADWRFVSAASTTTAAAAP